MIKLAMRGIALRFAFAVAAAVVGGCVVYEPIYTIDLAALCLRRHS